MSVNLTAQVLKSILQDTEGLSERSLTCSKPCCAKMSWDAPPQVQVECKAECSAKHTGLYLQAHLVDWSAVSYIAKAV